MLSDVSILITAGGRPGYLEQAVWGIARNLPECKTVVVNDDKVHPYEVSVPNVIWKQLPRDSFLTAKRNAGVALVDTKYTLLAADDFEFDIDSRATVINMVEALGALEQVDVIAGRVNNRPYEGFLKIKDEYIKELRLYPGMAFPYAGTRIWKVDIAANFFLARTSVLREVKWDETIGPIGGEHADWFFDMMEAKKNIAWSPLFNINEQPKDLSKEDPGYRARRARAQVGHELMLKKRGVKKYFSFDEEVSK